MEDHAGDADPHPLAMIVKTSNINHRGEVSF